MKAVEKIKGYYEEHEIQIKAIASAVTLSASSLMIGYIMGNKVCTVRFGLGLEKMFEETPELKEQFAEALCKANVARLMES